MNSTKTGNTRKPYQNSATLSKGRDRKLFGQTTNSLVGTMPTDLVGSASAILDSVWGEILSAAEGGQLPDIIEKDESGLLESIKNSVNSSTRTYRYVLPTQLLAKVANPSLDCRSLQAGADRPGAFDARTVAHQVIVPFDQANDRVLGGSPEPYVNNPVRVPEVSVAFRTAQRNRKDWDHLCNVLETVERVNDEDFAENVLRQVFTEIYRRLSEVKVVYPAPRRISLSHCVRLIDEYLAELSGGDRLLALSSALFVVIGRRFQLYSEVQRSTITASDASTGMLADLECVTEDGEIVLVVEVKDRALTVSQMTGKIPNIREKQVSETFFVAQQGVEDPDYVQSLVEQEFVSGQNIYVMSLSKLAEVSLALIGEEGRRNFLLEVGAQLDRYRSDIKHRRDWATLLASI